MQRTKHCESNQETRCQLERLKADIVGVPPAKRIKQKQRQNDRVEQSEQVAIKRGDKNGYA